MPDLLSSGFEDPDTVFTRLDLLCTLLLLVSKDIYLEYFKNLVKHESKILFSCVSQLF